MLFRAVSSPAMGTTANRSPSFPSIDDVIQRARGSFLAETAANEISAVAIHFRDELAAFSFPFCTATGRGGFFLRRARR